MEFISGERRGASKVKAALHEVYSGSVRRSVRFLGTYQSFDLLCKQAADRSGTPCRKEFSLLDCQGT
jgi:hypothetical protein